MNRIVIAEQHKVLPLGYQGEDEATEVIFSYADVAERHPGGVLSAVFIQPGVAQPAPIVLTIDADARKAHWLVTEPYVVNSGDGKLQLIWTYDGKEKSKVWDTKTMQSIVGTPVPPADVPQWIDQLTELGAETLANAQMASEAAEIAVDAKEAAIKAEDAAEAAAEKVQTMTADAETGEAGSEASAEYDPQTNNIHFVIPRGQDAIHPYTSLERLRSYLYRVTFESIPERVGEAAFALGGCSSLVKDGKLYRNLDWKYDETNTFVVVCNNFTGIAFDSRLKETEQMDEQQLGQLPYHIVDGVNSNGIMVSTHVLFNDWDWHGCGEKTVPMSIVPYLVMSRVKSMETVAADLADVIANLSVPETFVDYLCQFLITDGTTTFVMMPPESSTGSYQLVDATSVPKLTNFRWVNYATVERAADYMQNRPTGVERWNSMTDDFAALRYTVAYEQPTRLSEFIGIDDTTKDSTDAELMTIYTEAHQRYLDRARDGELWQTMHSVVYSASGIDKLYVQEDWSKNWVSGDPGAPSSLIDDTQESSEKTYSSQKINQHLQSKLDKPEDPPAAVGKVLKVKTVNPDGSFVCEWADGGSGAVEDVQVNGTTIVDDNGVANIPYATNSQKGLVGGYTGYGMSFNNGNPFAVTRTAVQFEDDSNTMFTSFGTLKNVLAAPSIMPVLTDAEKAAAKQRLGITSGYEHIKIFLEEEVSTLSFVNPVTGGSRRVFIIIGNGGVVANRILNGIKVNDISVYWETITRLNYNINIFDIKINDFGTLVENVGNRGTSSNSGQAFNSYKTNTDLATKISMTLTQGTWVEGTNVDIYWSK